MDSQRQGGQVRGQREGNRDYDAGDQIIVVKVLTQAKLKCSYNCVQKSFE